MSDTQFPLELTAKLEALDPQTSLVERHLLLLSFIQWLRDGESSVRLDLFLDHLQARPALTLAFQRWFGDIFSHVDASTLLADYGFSSRSALISEVVTRLQRQYLPRTPETSDASELFDLAFDSEHDAAWLGAITDSQLQRLAQLLAPSRTVWQEALVQALTVCTSQIRASGLSSDIRSRRTMAADGGRPFQALAFDLEAVLTAWRDAQNVPHALRHFRATLNDCQQSAATVYEHLDAYGISVDLVFRLRQMRARIQRVHALLDCLVGSTPGRSHVRLLAHLVHVSQEQCSLRELISSSSSLLAAKVVERHSEVGDYYITRTSQEYKEMLGRALGGGALMAFTTALKFAVLALGLSAFWSGVGASLVYAASFVLIQLMHFTLATKQPAMTAPAMASKLKKITGRRALNNFVDEVVCLVRSQVAAVLGNVLAVFPLVLLLSYALLQVGGAHIITTQKAHHVLESLSLLGPSVLFAAFTGVLLFVSSVCAGWVENWFVLHRLGSALRYNPRITHLLGAVRATRFAEFMQGNIAALTSNISLGLMLGLLPPILAFLGLPLDVRHVTLSTGQLGAAAAALGWQVVHLNAFWWAFACLPLLGALNVGVSFYFAFRIALRAHDVSGLNRSRIYRAIWQRFAKEPLSFVSPVRHA